MYVFLAQFAQSFPQSTAWGLKNTRDLHEPLTVHSINQLAQAKACGLLFPLLPGNYYSRLISHSLTYSYIANLATIVPVMAAEAE